jgi:hypothetical protein
MISLLIHHPQEHQMWQTIVEQRPREAFAVGGNRAEQLQEGSRVARRMGKLGNRADWRQRPGGGQLPCGVQHPTPRVL